MKTDTKIGIKTKSFFKTIFVSFIYVNIKKNYNNIDCNRVIKKIFSSILLIPFLTSYYIITFQKDNFCNKLDTIGYDIVIPMDNNNTHNIDKLNFFLRKNINFSNIIIISPNKSSILEKNNSFIIINEDELVPKSDLIDIFLKKGINNTNRVGWYEQQFLKMSYAKICNHDYYLLWDSDTFPIKPLQMFDNDIPIFDMKKEHHSPYFTTISLLIDNLKLSKLSYISEHMIIKTELMKKLIDKIETNKNIKGKFFWEKILWSIDNDEILKSGFSEYETYGTFVDNYFKNSYKHRLWHSKRDMVNYYGNIENVNNNDLNWLSKDYNAITFEKWDIFNINNLKCN